jgi:hypothetical protein
MDFRQPSCKVSSPKMHSSNTCQYYNLEICNNCEHGKQQSSRTEFPQLLFAQVWSMHFSTFGKHALHFWTTLLVFILHSIHMWTPNVKYSKPNSWTCSSNLLTSIDYFFISGNSNNQLFLFIVHFIQSNVNTSNLLLLPSGQLATFGSVDGK